MTAPSDKELAASARRELLEDILPFWRRHTVDERRGGFIGQMSNDLHIQDDAPKGLILNARILWTFSAAYAYTQDDQDGALARRAYEYLTDHFLDREHGGYFWELDPGGTVRDDKKKIYGEAFCIYALSEYFRVFHEPAALQQAMAVFDLIEAHARDAQYGGYFEVMSRDWQPGEDMRLSDKDMNEKKSMNNHLHVLEGYTNLLRVLPWRGRPGLALRVEGVGTPNAIHRVWEPFPSSNRGQDARDTQGQDALATSLRGLIDIFQRHILNAEQTHLQHFFDDAWAPKSDSYTFGHDIEASWLLCEAAEGLGDQRLMTEVQNVALRIARTALAAGLDADGGLFYEGREGRIINPNKEWWPQAEAVVGFYNAWQLTGEDAFREAAVRCWQFIQNRVVDHEHGEWFWCIRPDGTPDPAVPKVSFWKGPYHNGRCCLELIRRCSTPAPGGDSSPAEGGWATQQM
jgi:mannobiose 2-epimerase